MTREWGGALAAHMRRIAALRQVEMLLDWDRETQMPPKGAAQRAEQAAAVAEALHGLETDPRLADWLATAADGAEGTAAVNVAEAARVHARATRVPARLAAEIARAAVEGQTAWAAARAASAPRTTTIGLQPPAATASTARFSQDVPSGSRTSALG